MGKEEAVDLKDETVRGALPLFKLRSKEDRLRWQKLLEMMFSALSGGQGKISLSSVKISLLTATGGLTQSPVPASSLSRLASLASALSSSRLHPAAPSSLVLP